MAISTALCDVTKVGFMRGRHLSADTYNIALYHEDATLGSTSTRYLAADEVATASGYTATGQKALNVTMTVSSTHAIFDFDDLSWINSTFTCRGALLYNTSLASNEAIASFNFGATKSVSAGTFTLRLPAPASGTALLEIDN